MTQVAALVERAKKAQLLWAKEPLIKRQQALAAVRRRILDRGEALAECMWRELGKPWGDTFPGEVIASADMIAAWLKHGPRFLAPRKVALDPLTYARKRCEVRLVPKGVIGLITPWNMPVAIPLRCVVPALLAGNAVVWKPSEVCPETSSLLFQQLAGLLPEDVFQLALGDGKLGSELVESAIDHVAFTGSLATGRRIEKICADKGTTCSLELGGKDAAIVLADAPLDRTVQGVVWGAFNMSGQNCSSIERVIVQRPIAEKLIPRLVEVAKSLRTGPQAAIDTCDVGPLANDRQLAIVERHVKDAIQAGAKLLCGGEHLGHRFYAPTVLTDVPVESALWREETFGPVLPIVVVDSVDDAVHLANDSHYGLTASVWTADVERGEGLLARLDTGVGMVNNACFTGALAMAAWTGVKGSGHGTTNSEFSLYELTRPRTVLIDKSTAVRELWWYPFTPAFRRLTLAMSQLLAGHVSALFFVIKWLPKRFKREA